MLFLCSIYYTVIRFLWVSDKFSTCIVVRVNGTLVEDKVRRFKGECEHFSFNKCPIYTHDGASAKFSTNSQEMDNSVGILYCNAGSIHSFSKRILLTWRKGQKSPEFTLQEMLSKMYILLTTKFLVEKRSFSWNPTQSGILSAIISTFADVSFYFSNEHHCFPGSSWPSICCFRTNSCLIM